MYQVKIEKDVIKFLQKHQDIVTKFKYCVDCISKDPLSEFCDTKKLQGIKNVYRLRIGKRRFLYKVKDNEIMIYFFDAGSRGDIYT